MESIKSEIQQKAILKNEGFNYQMEYEHTNCSFEILLNGIPVATHFVPNSLYINAQLNPMILGPGKQELTIRMFPQKLNENSFAKTLDENSKVILTVIKDKRNSDPMWAWSEEAKNSTWTIVSYETPKIGKDKQYVEYKISFDLNNKDVNWHTTGWSDSQVLINNGQLKKEVMDFYKNMADVINNKNIDKYLGLRKQQILEEVNCYPYDKNGLSDLIESMSKSIEMDQAKLFFLDDNSTEIKFYANNKVVSLVSTNPKFFGYPPLISQGKKDKYASGFVIYLHKPKGSDKLEIIR